MLFLLSFLGGVKFYLLFLLTKINLFDSFYLCTLNLFNMEKFICPGKTSLEKMSSETNCNLLAKTNGKVIKRIVLKVNGKKLNGGLVNAFHFNDELSLDKNDLCLVFVEDKFVPCLEKFLVDDLTSSIVVESQEISGYVLPKVKYKMSLVSRVISKKNSTEPFTKN